MLQQSENAHLDYLILYTELFFFNWVFLMQSWPLCPISIDCDYCEVRHHISRGVWAYVQADGLWMAHVQTEQEKHVGICQTKFLKRQKICERFWDSQCQEHTKA